MIVMVPRSLNFFFFAAVLLQAIGGGSKAIVRVVVGCGCLLAVGERESEFLCVLFASEKKT